MPASPSSEDAVKPEDSIHSEEIAYLPAVPEPTPSQAGRRTSMRRRDEAQLPPAARRARRGPLTRRCHEEHCGVRPPGLPGFRVPEKLPPGSPVAGAEDRPEAHSAALLRQPALQPG